MCCNWPSSASVFKRSGKATPISSISANFHVPFPQSQSIRILIRRGPRKYSVPSLMVGKKINGVYHALNLLS